MQAPIQKVGQGGSFDPMGGLEPKICSKLPENCRILKKSWRQGAGPQGPQGPMDPLFLANKAVGDRGDRWRVHLQHTSPACNLSTLWLRYQVPKINTASAEWLGRAMLLLPLAIKTLATASLPCCHTLTRTDYLAPLRTRHRPGVQSVISGYRTFVAINYASEI